ncbi:methyltransferase domain-containing protein [Candidatus Peregrinibacteria bacterium]|nr:methyltransferase domain-containing protein [Candidatus Peregrinibacteria bacterium]
MGSKDILQEVKRSYSAIAHEFDATRDRPWQEFKIFLDYLRKQAQPVFASARSESGHRMHDPPALFRQTLASANNRLRLLDVGCGNGRLSHFLKKNPIEYTGVDNNRTMLRIAKKKNPHAVFRFAEITKLPFPARSFGAAWCIAVLHHLPTKKLRLQALKEIKRILKPNGLLFITVWNLWQPKYRKYIDQKTQNAEIPWGTEKKILRYYYAFKQNELRDLLKSAGFKKIKKITSNHNFAFIA